MTARIAYLAVAAIAAGIALGGCSASRELPCEGDEQCMRGGETGTCVQPEGFCAFDDPSCDSGLRWDSTAGDSLAETCVADGDDLPDAGSGDASQTNACGGQSPLEDEPGTACGACASGTWECTGEDSVACMDAVSLSTPITFEGSVSASTEFSGSFEAPLSVDGDLSTSWFSSGPKGGGTPTVYLWTASQDDCIESIAIHGNGQHQNPGFREMYGFGQVTVQVLDAGDDVVFSETLSLPGTPDPDVTSMPLTSGRAVRLLFLGHESDDCGGFSELVINALR